ncbi:hypothetical protein GCM10010522_20150 [Kribbella solani]
MMDRNSSDQAGGTERLLVRSITVTGNELRASLCSDGWDVFYFAADGTYHGEQSELALRTLVMRKSGPVTTPDTSTSHTRPAAQELVADTKPSPSLAGRTPYDIWLKGPRDNVFNNWIATSWDVSSRPPNDCVTWFKQNHPTVRYPSDYAYGQRPNHPVSPPPPTLPNDPGW